LQKLPDVPPFPFPPTPQVPSTPLSLADALGLEEGNAQQQAQALTTAPNAGIALSPAAPVFAPFSTEYGSEAFSPFDFDYAAGPDTEPADGFVFCITLRKADGCSFGLATSAVGCDGVLHIDGVLPGGAAEAWNRQCGSSGAAEKVLLPGDAIVSVNGITGSPEDMKFECENQQLLRLMVVRSDGPRSAPPPHVPAVSERSTMLRAEASAFVPLSVDASEFVPMGMSPCEEQYDSIGLPIC